VRVEHPSATRNAQHDLGERSEARVAAWLAGAGWRVLARRLRIGGAELDIVAIDPDEILVGIEVRAPRSERTGAPLETLGRDAIHRRRHALAAYAQQAPWHRGLRLDLVSVTPRHGQWLLSRLPGIDVP
jgi:Holliday junction resolvase-like predicted endonuclease